MFQTELDIFPPRVAPAKVGQNGNAAFRPIQYLGSKLRLVKEISEIIESNKTSNRVCDLFSGSGVVSHYLANKNEVISLDIQYYSTIISSALINGRKFSKSEIASFISEAKSNPIFSDLQFIYEPLTSLEESLLKSKLASDDDKIKFASFVENCSVYSYLKSNNLFSETDTENFVLTALKKFEERFKVASELARKLSYCSFYYGGVYFSFRQSIMIDALLFKINELKSIDEPKYSILLASLLSTLSEIVATVGKQFAQPMKLTDKNNKPKTLLASRSVRDRNYDVETIFTKWLNEYSNNCFQQTNNKSITSDYKYFLDNCKENIGCFYADPPYTIDHYSRFYHILESIALYDYPELAAMNKSNVGNVIMKGLYRVDRHQSLFCIPSQAKGAFTDLFQGASKFNCPLLLSYSPFEENTTHRPRLLSIDEIISLAKKFYESVEVIEIKEHKHRKLNKAQNNSEALKNGEVMILCKQTKN
jgi:adenine-specific DNA-methyltransferase